MLDFREPRKDWLLEFARMIGVPGTLALCEGWPGIRLYIPHADSLSADHPIALKIGLEVALKLSRECGGSTIPIPRNARLSRATFRALVLTRFRNGESASKLAREFGLHEYTIYRWAGAEKDQRQASLL
ncbi:MAG: Mor transcription activator family protein [Panacagrimonas sp.]